MLSEIRWDLMASDQVAKSGLCVDFLATDLDKLFIPSPSLGVGSHHGFGSKVGMTRQNCVKGFCSEPTFISTMVQRT